MTNQARENLLLAARGRFKDRLCVVVGAGASGIAAGRLLARLGARLRFVDSGDQISGRIFAKVGADVELFRGPHNPEQFEDAHLVVMSPGVPIRTIAPHLGNLPRTRVVAEMELASWFCPEPVLAVTGSNGKTTTVSMIAKVMGDTGHRVFLGGNIGTPLSEHVLSSREADVLVLEASSFQLQTCRTFRPRAALLLNLSPNHLDYHRDMEEYAKAKFRLFQAQTPADLAVFPESLRKMVEDRSDLAAEVRFYPDAEVPGRFSCPALAGTHNTSNMEAAYALLRDLGATEAAMNRSLETFAPPPHRMQVVGKKRGVLFVDDSKATTLEAALAAARSFQRPVRLLMGGVFKGGDVAAFAASINGCVAQVALFGESREVFEGPLSARLSVTWSPTMEEAIRELWSRAAEGEVILLSPGTASFDQYSGYKERGNDFQRVFKELP